MSGTTTGGGVPNGPHAIIKKGDKEVPMTESEWEKFVEWIKEHLPHLHSALTD